LIEEIKEKKKAQEPVIKGAMTKEEIKEQDSKTDNVPEPIIKGTSTEEEIKEEVKEEKEASEKVECDTKIFAVRTTANREDQVMDFISSNADRKGLEVFSIIRPHGMRGYIFMEAGDRTNAEQAAYGIPYGRGLLPNMVNYKEIEHMLEQVKKEVNIQKNDIAEIITGPFKREKCKITRVDKQKSEVVVELLEAAVPIPITVKMDSVKVIRREDEEE